MRNTTTRRAAGEGGGRRIGERESSATQRATDEKNSALGLVFFVGGCIYKAFQRLKGTRVASLQRGDAMFPRFLFPA